MEKKKINVGILFGGKSAEHEVSLQSATNVIDAIDKEKYNTILIGIDRSGKWSIADNLELSFNYDSPKQIRLNQLNDNVALLPQSKGKISKLNGKDLNKSVDVVFPILHGPFGEDGSIQGLLKLANIPFVGAGVLGSAIGMDKDVMKRLLRDSGISIADFITVDSNEQDTLDLNRIIEKLGLPLFIKPANMGSSVGVHKINDLSEFEPALQDAFRFDRKALIEEFINGMNNNRNLKKLLKRNL